MNISCGQCCYFKLLVIFPHISPHVERPALICIYIITVSPKVHCMIVTIHLSAGFSPPSGMLQPGGYQIPPPQHLYSGVGGHQPSSGPSQLQQGMTKCAHTLSCTAMLFVSKLTVIFFWLTFTTRSIHEGPFYFFFISDHLSMHVPCSNNKMSKEIETSD